MSNDHRKPRPRGAKHQNSYENDEPHSPRIILQVIPPPDIIMAAARRFAAGEITRADLSYILRGGRA